MDIEKLADRLAYYNEWRRGMDGKQPHPVELGADIDEAVSALREIAHLRAELESAPRVPERKLLTPLLGLYESARCLGVAQANDDTDAITHWKQTAESMIAEIKSTLTAAQETDHD